MIDWHSIVDRTRNLRGNGHWDKPEDVIASARYSYLLNKWDGQPNYVEVWVEKDALVDIVGQACIPLDTPYFHVEVIHHSQKCGQQHNDL